MDRPERIRIAFISLHPEDPGVLDRLPTEHEVDAGSTVESFLIGLGLNEAARAALWSARSVAVFGVTARPSTRLQAGDRIEVLDVLRFDPMESRRRRATHRRHPPKSRQRLVSKDGV